MWATKRRQEWLTPEIEDIVLKSIQDTSRALDCRIFAINACLNHVHVAAAIGTHLAVRDWVGRVKGASSRQVNKMTNVFEGHFRWQKSYGVMTFGQNNLDKVIAYIDNQKAHHLQDTTNSHLEYVGEVEEDD